MTSSGTKPLTVWPLSYSSWHTEKDKELELRPVFSKRLHWEIRPGDTTVFEARCRDARLRSGSVDVVLRGHVTVTTNGTTLECNCITLDMRNDRIVAEGRYVLTRDGKRQFGAGSCFDTKLEVVDAGSS